MATRTIANGGGNWDSTSSWVEGAVPTSADDVVATASSGNLTINVAAACRSIDLSSYTGTLTHAAGITLSVGDGSGGALNFSGSWTYTKGNNTTSTISFVSTSNNGGAGWNITFGGKSPGSVTFNGSGGEWTLQDGSTSTGTWTFTEGELNTNDQDISVLKLFHQTNNYFTLNLGASEVTVTQRINDYGVYFSGRYLTINAGTSKLIISKASVMLTSHTFYDIEYQFNQDFLPDSSMIRGNITCHDFTATGGAHKNSNLLIANGNTLTVTNSIVFAGNSSANRLLVTSSTLGASGAISYSSASVAGWQNVDFQDISFSASVDASAITGGSGDCGGNTNLTATTADDWYWNGSGTRNFSDYTYWYTATNGGGSQMASTRPPLPQDNCYIDANSIDGTTRIDMDLSRPCKNLDFTGAGALTFDIDNNMVTFFGSVTLVSNVTLTVSNNSSIYTVFSGRGSYTITSAGKSWGQIRISAYGGTYTLQDAFQTTGSNSVFYLLNGTFNPNNYNVSVGGFYISGGSTRAYQGGTETLTTAGVTTAFYAQTITNLTWTAPAVIHATNASASITTMNLNTLTFNELRFTPGGTGKVLFSGAFTFSGITLSSEGTKNIRFTKNTTYTITGDKFIDGNGANVVTIDTDTAGTPFTLSKASGTVSADYLSLKDSTATGGATFYAGSHSTDVSGNTGWTFSDPPTEASGHLNLLLLGAG